VWGVVDLSSLSPSGWKEEEEKRKTLFWDPFQRKGGKSRRLQNTKGNVVILGVVEKGGVPKKF